MCSVSESGSPQQSSLSPECHRIQRGISVLSIQGRGPLLPGSHNRMTSTGVCAHLPFKVSRYIKQLDGKYSQSPQCSRVSITPTLSCLGKSKPLLGAGLGVCWALPMCSPDPLSAPHHSARCPRTPSDMTASARFTFPLAPGWVWPVGNTSRRLEGGGEGHGALLPTTLQFAEAAPSLLGHDSTPVTPVCSCNTHQTQEAPPLSASHTKDSNDSPILANLGMLHHPIALPTHADLFIELLLCVPS